jgi:hypothetical protein
MTFQELMQHFEQRLGHHQVPLNARASSLQTLFESGPLHQELMTRIAAAIYKRNRCGSLRDTVTRTATFDALAPIRLEVLHARDTDIDVFHLIEDVCVATSTYFGPVSAATVETTLGGRAEVIPFDRSRARKLKSSA